MALHSSIVVAQIRVSQVLQYRFQWCIDQTSVMAEGDIVSYVLERNFGASDRSSIFVAETRRCHQENASQTIREENILPRRNHE